MEEGPSERMVGSDPNPSTRDSNAPPSDGSCPICLGPLGAFSIPSRTQCGHWYCAGCILRWWNDGSKPCKCPLCSRPISKLTTVTSMHHQQEEGVTKALENIRKYNRLFGPKKGLVLPLIIKRIFHHLHKLCFVAISLAALYSFCSFDFPKIDDGREQDSNPSVLDILLNV
ncbi:uncharacterized protein LOC132300458 isoform X2 [Cornus florida]|uniref:uncharacterized protein LOC132300458 isoform X2 n=1 Tax=Cornus florida TaxID=4283 RepID=UPI002899BE8D|nr:uncharacterized protein LOC132300458 isoform X2 [Cornus florida]